eukprot:9725592-Alexandrium_andersonii.AAC.1
MSLSGIRIRSSESHLAAAREPPRSTGSEPAQPMPGSSSPLRSSGRGYEEAFLLTGPRAPCALVPPAGPLGVGLPRRARTPP